MQLTIAAWDDRVFPVELDANEPFATLMAILEAESGLPAAQQQLLHNGRPVPPSAHGQGLTALGIADGDMLMLMPLQQQGGAGQGQQQRSGAGVGE
jgi:DNA damage-inducible protein 1